MCKSCQYPVFCEELEERSGQGVRLGFVCTNANCSLIQIPFNSSSKSGKLFDINRASTLAFRAIGRGQLAAAKTLTILGLPKPSRKPVWCENTCTKIIADACSELVREELEHSARNLCCLFLFSLTRFSLCRFNFFFHTHTNFIFIYINLPSPPANSKS